MIIIAVFTFVIFILLTTTGGEKWTIPIDYSLSASEYKSLGEVIIHKLPDANWTGEFVPESNLIFEDLKNSISKSAELESKDYSKRPQYRIKTGDLISSNFAHYFKDANFVHIINLFIDPVQRSLHSITHYPDVSIYADNEQVPLSKNDPLIRIVVNSVQEVSGPETAAYLQRIEEEKRARQHGAMQDNRSFLAKYWMYIVPIALFMVFSNAFAGEQQNANE